MRVSVASTPGEQARASAARMRHGKRCSCMTHVAPQWAAVLAAQRDAAQRDAKESQLAPLAVRRGTIHVWQQRGWGSTCGSQLPPPSSSSAPAAPVSVSSAAGGAAARAVLFPRLLSFLMPPTKFRFLFIVVLVGTSRPACSRQHRDRREKSGPLDAERAL